MIGEEYEFIGRVKGSTFIVEKIEGRRSPSFMLIKFKNRSMRDGKYSITFHIFKKIKDGRGLQIFLAYPTNFKRIEEKFIRKKINGYVFNIFFCYSKSFYFFCRGIVIGGKEVVDKDLMKLLREVGLIHLLALSGLHLHFIVKNTSSIFKKIGLEDKYLNIFLFILLTTYLYMVDFSASLIRAYIMEIIKIFGYSMGEKVDPRKSFSVSLILSLILFPSLIESPAFVMSYSATFALVFIKLPCKNRLLRLFLRNLSIFLILLPAQIYYFNNIYPISPITNTLFLFPFSILIQLIFMTILLYPLPFVGKFTAHISYFIFILLISILNFIRRLSDFAYR